MPYVLCCRLRKADKKKKKLPIHVKNPAKKKDPKKLMLKALEEKVAQEGACLAPPVMMHTTPSPPPSFGASRY